MGINQKFLELQAGLGEIGKDRANTFSKYRYLSADALASALRPHFAKNGLIHRVTCLTFEHSISSEPSGRYTQALVNVELTITDVETGEALTSTMPGFAQDKNGDKALFKAITGATKYVYFKLLGISSQDDPENDEAEAAKPVSEAVSIKKKSEKSPLQKSVDALQQKKITPHEFFQQTEYKTINDAVTAFQELFPGMTLSDRLTNAHRDVLDLFKASGLTQEEFKTLTGFESIKALTLEEAEAVFVTLSSYLTQLNESEAS
jgi:hypothetical protein